MVELDKNRVVEIIEGAIKIISDESRWTIGATALDSNRRIVDVLSPEAVGWCAIGAMYKAEGINTKDDIDNDNNPLRRASQTYQLLEYLGEEGSYNIAETNDEDGREAVIQALNDIRQELLSGEL